MVDKLLKYGNITELENKILTRLENRNLIFGNIIQLAEIKILCNIYDLKNNEDYFQECNFCQDKFSITALKNIDDDLVCENCLDNHFQILHNHL